MPGADYNLHRIISRPWSEAGGWSPAGRRAYVLWTLALITIAALLGRGASDITSIVIAGIVIALAGAIEIELPRFEGTTVSFETALIATAAWILPAREALCTIVLVALLLGVLSPGAHYSWFGACFRMSEVILMCMTGVLVASVLQGASLPVGLALAFVASLIVAMVHLQLVTRLLGYDAEERKVVDIMIRIEVGFGLPLAMLLSGLYAEWGIYVLALAIPLLLTIRLLANSHLQVEVLRDDARTDALTGLPNRRALESDALAHVQTSLDSGGSIAVVILDIDCFKSVNDSHGHDVGDRVLQSVAGSLASLVHGRGPCAMRAYRAGGEEFVLLLSGAGEATAVTDVANLVAETVRTAGSPVPVTASLGAAIRLPSNADAARIDLDAGLVWHDLLRRADRELYAAKAAGRDCVRVAA